MGVEGGSYTGSESEPFKAEEGSALKLAGPGSPEVPAECMLDLRRDHQHADPQPNSCPDSDDTEFTLRADGSGLRGGVSVRGGGRSHHGHGNQPCSRVDHDPMSEADFPAATTSLALGSASCAA